MLPSFLKLLPLLLSAFADGLLQLEFYNDRECKGVRVQVIPASGGCTQSKIPTTGGEDRVLGLKFVRSGSGPRGILFVFESGDCGADSMLASYPASAAGGNCVSAGIGGVDLLPAKLVYSAQTGVGGDAPRDTHRGNSHGKMGADVPVFVSVGVGAVLTLALVGAICWLQRADRAYSSGEDPHRETMTDNPLHFSNEVPLLVSEGMADADAAEFGAGAGVCDHI